MQWSQFLNMPVGEDVLWTQSVECIVQSFELTGKAVRTGYEGPCWGWQSCLRTGVRPLSGEPLAPGRRVCCLPGACDGAVGS